MEDILLMQKENSLNSPSKIKEILQQISNAHFESDKITQRLEENATHISELTKEVAALKNEFEIEKQNLESKVYKSEEHNRLLQNLKEDKENLELNFSELETRLKSMKKTKPSLRDQQLIECGKRKHKLYKEFTGIRWDYTAAETLIEGYITNKKDFLQKISYKSDIDYKTLRELCWKVIQRSTMDSIAREDYKENKPFNM